MSQSTSTFDPFGAIYTDLYVAQPLDLDYDEPNAVVEATAMEFVVLETAVQQVEMPVTNTTVRTEPAPRLVEAVTPLTPQRTAA